MGKKQLAHLFHFKDIFVKSDSVNVKPCFIKEAH